MILIIKLIDTHNQIIIIDFYKYDEKVLKNSSFYRDIYLDIDFGGKPHGIL